MLVGSTFRHSAPYEVIVEFSLPNNILDCDSTTYYFVILEEVRTSIVTELFDSIIGVGLSSDILRLFGNFARGLLWRDIR